MDTVNKFSYSRIALFLFRMIVYYSIKIVTDIVYCYLEKTASKEIKGYQRFCLYLWYLTKLWIEKNRGLFVLCEA